MKKDFLAIIGVLLILFSFFSSLMGVISFMDYLKLPDWLRYVLAIPSIVLSMFISSAALKELYRQFSIDKKTKKE